MTAPASKAPAHFPGPEVGAAAASTAAPTHNTREEEAMGVSSPKPLPPQQPAPPGSPQTPK